MKTRCAALSVLLIVILLAMVVAFEPARAGGPWYVALGGNNEDDCLSPASSCATINGAVAKASAGDIIYVATGTYLGSGDQVVLLDKSVHISGGWNAYFDDQDGMSTIDGEVARGGITVSSTVSATVERLVIQRGKGFSWTGGGIQNEGTLTVSECSIRDTEGRGIRNTGTMTLSFSEVSRNDEGVNGTGGGIDNRGVLTITHSTISDNVAGTGGGIVNRKDSINDPLGGSIVLYNSTIKDNIGTGLVNYGGSSLVLNNSTISGNLPNEEGAGGGGIRNDGILTLNNTTVSNNVRPSGDSGSGGIWNRLGTATLQNSIVAGNHHRWTYSGDCTGTFTSLGYNLIGMTTDCSIASGPGDLFDVSAWLTHLVGSPGYHPLFRNSPAINAGNPAGCTDHLSNPLDVDQRGVARVGRCDIGSYEYDPDNDPLSHNYLPLINALEQ